MDVRLGRGLSFVVSAAAVILVTLLFRLVAAVNATTIGFAYLITILIVAASLGIFESILASLVAAVCFNYFFLPPVGTWTIQDPENWVALFAFLISALIASELSNRARRRTAEANTRQIEMERLYSLSRAIMTMDTSTGVNAIASDLARIFEIPAVVIYDRVHDVIYRSGEDASPELDATLKHAAQVSVSSRDEVSGTLFAPINLGPQCVGSVAIRGGELSDAALHALLNLIAITFESTRSREIATRALAARQSEEFKSTLLDGLAHEFKTPLTSIKAATTALLASNVSDAAQRQELISIVNQEAERLNRLVTEATRVARVEAGKLQLNRVWCPIDILIETVIDQSELQLDGRVVNVAVESNLPKALVDPDLMQLALRQLVDNALKYSPRKSGIRVTSTQTADSLLITVHNQGEPLSAAERNQVFDKFYRGQNVRHQVAGTGMGLPVAREILIAHGGNVHLKTSDETGTEFVVTIPIWQVAG